VTAQSQLNGLVILYAYLQRIFVYDMVLATIPGDPPRLPAPDTANLLDRTSAAIGRCDPRAGLPADTVVDMDAVLAAASDAMAARVARPNAPQRERIAAIAGDRFHHRHLVEGLVFWGDRYQPETADRYRQQLLSTRAAAQDLTALVARAADGPLPASDLAQIDTWYESVVATAGNIPKDLALIARLIHSQP